MSGKISCTVGVLTRNSGKSLCAALESVKDFAEIIICDGGSTDDTLEIARAFGARIIAQDPAFLDESGYIQNFSGVRNQLFHAAAHDWFFYVDSDEYASPELVASIRRIIETRKSGAFNIFRRYVLSGREVTCSISYPNRSMRFFSKKSVIGFRKIVHERPELRPGVSAEDMPGALFVPVEPDRANVRQRNERYIALELKRKGYVTIPQFIGYAFWEVQALLSYSVRLVRMLVFCRGVRFPLSMELGRYWYVQNYLWALWRARSKEYPPRVLFLINKWKTGGAEHVFLQEIEALKEEGYVVYFCAMYGMEIPPGLDPRYCIFPQFKHLFDIPAYRRFIKILGYEGITHIVSVLDHASIVARLAGLFSWRQRIVLVEAGMASRKPWRYKLLDILLNWRVQAIIAVSRGVAQSLSYQPYRSRIHVVPNGVVLEESVRDEKRDHPFRMLFVGSLRAEKGLDTLLASFAQYLEVQKTGELILVGKGVLLDALKKQVAALGIETSVRFLGELSHSEVQKWYANVDCFVFPSVSEGFGLVLVEAMASGLPVIATRSAGALDIVEDTTSGLLVPIGDTKSLADAMCILANDSEFRQQLGDAARLRAQEFSLERHMHAFRKILFIS